MDVADFDYELPAGLVAQRPLPQRARSRLLLLDPVGGTIEHHRFEALPALLAPADLLVVNDTRVFPARLVGRKSSGGRVELLLVERLRRDATGETWQCLMRASRSPKAGESLGFSELLQGTVVERDGELARVALRAATGNVRAAVERLGRVPLPPYIHRPQPDATPAVDDRERYQTVYARHEGAAAAPTAGLHFTGALLDRLRRRGIDHVSLTLHVGPGTFQPVRVPRVEDHRMHEERYDLPVDTAKRIARARHEGGRIVAVGTTVARALEHCATEDGVLHPGRGRCDLFIYPGYRFRIVDDLLTNFHLPRSTLLMLVAALAGRETLLRAYREAVRLQYRFFSYGDAMLVRSRA